MSSILSNDESGCLIQLICVLNRLLESFGNEFLLLLDSVFVGSEPLEEGFYPSSKPPPQQG